MDNAVKDREKNQDQDHAQCRCGHVSFEITGKPLLRGYCHCTICQEFNQADRADISLYRAKDIAMPEESRVEYKAYTSPPMVYRGKCVECQQPAIEYISLPLMPKLVIVPTFNIKNQASLPKPQFHLFYRSRVGDSDDGLPKYDGYFKSQLSLMAALIRGYVTR